MITFNTDHVSRGGTVNNINGNHIIHITINLAPGCTPPAEINQILQHIHASSSTSSRGPAQLRRPSETPSGQIAKIYVAVDPFYNSAMSSIDQVRVTISIVQTMMANPMLCPSKDLPETLASLKRLMELMELALRAYQHTDLAPSLSRAISIRVEECRPALEELISQLNLINFRHILFNTVLYFIRKHMWARIGWKGSAISALDSKFRKSHSSFAACLLALGR
ncbi:hypothetical protein FIBSPDRAFT_38365 [Athelia psychrophila]|uniref:Uncharacterized protein n=1 Tax=Athelia psychrophila TaxID=1759441 RepID=A0A166FJC3_9AGAM|nr:hypothetical protein FIBSPDRAFT_38365 [Fibularhizoctonia sp. CBS 109695]